MSTKDLQIHVFPDACLRRKAERVEEFDQRLGAIVETMTGLMYGAPGIGLAAVQCNLNRRLVLVDVSEHRDDLRVLVNPRITASEGEQEFEEGCLSLPGVYAPVVRARQIQVEAQDTSGKPFSLEAEGLLSTCIQHEIDHLEGVLFVDRISRLKRDRLLKKYLREQKQPQT